MLLRAARECRAIVWFNSQDPGEAPGWEDFGYGRGRTEREAALKALEDVQAKGWDLSGLPWILDSWRTQDLRPRVFNVRLHVR